MGISPDVSAMLAKEARMPAVYPFRPAKEDAETARAFVAAADRLA